MKKLILSLTILTFLSCTALKAQMYKTAVGGRLGADYGLSLKYFNTDKTAIDIQLTNRLFGYNLGFVLTQNYPIKGVEHLNYYVGGGAHYGVISSKPDGDVFSHSKSNSSAIGIDASAGIEYYIEELNTAVAIDVQPRFEKVEKEFFNNWYVFGLSVRYCISK
jgi:hypothetical protein